MTKSQNTKDEQQKDLCITSEQLTELWKKGELPSGWYWVELKEGTFVDGKKSVILDYLFEFTNDFERHPYLVESVLAPVPSYEEAVAMKDCLKMVWKAAEREVKLKKLLKECLPYISRSLTSRMIKNSAGYKKDAKLLTKINQVLGENL